MVLMIDPNKRLAQCQCWRPMSEIRAGDAEQRQIQSCPGYLPTKSDLFISPFPFRIAGTVGSLGMELHGEALD